MLIRLEKGKNVLRCFTSTLFPLFLLIMGYGIGGSLNLIPKINIQKPIKFLLVKENVSTIEITSRKSKYYTIGNSASTVSTEEIAKKKKTVVLIECDRGTGSGFIINEEGYVLTNFHVIQGSDYYNAVFQDENDEAGKKIPLQLIFYDKEKDICLLKLDSNEKFDYMIFGSSDIVVDGQKIMTIGSPIGIINSISDGIIAGLRKINNTKYIQVTAALSPGNSGGVLLNMSGEVIGMNTFKVTNAENVNFAVATNEIINFLDEIEMRDNINPTKSESDIELKDEEILDILDKAQESFFHITHSFTDWSGHGLLHKEYDSPEKLQNYLKQYWTSTAIKSFVKFIDAKYIDNRYCITIGDGVREDILNGKILKKQRIKDIIYIALSVYDLNSQQPNIENYEIEFEDGKWLVDYFDSQFGEIGDK
jgi:serine protease Do